MGNVYDCRKNQQRTDIPQRASRDGIVRPVGSLQKIILYGVDIMKFYCNETDSKVNFFVEDTKNAKSELKDKLNISYPQSAFSNQCVKELIINNFTRLEKIIKLETEDFKWEAALELITQKFNEHKIEWYIVGSVCDAIRGVKVKPPDIDIVIHTKDFQKARDICYSDFAESVIAPFVDAKGMFAMRCFGRMFLAGILIEIAADETWNSESRQPGYEKAIWQGYDIYMESLQHRYQIEISRNRMDRIKVIEEYIKRTE